MARTNPDAPDHNRCYNFSAAPDFHRDDRV